MRIFTAIFLAGFFVTSGEAGVVLSEDGKAQAAIYYDAAATPPEKAAAEELANTLRQITGADFPLEVNGEAVPESAIVVGPGLIARRLFPEVPWDQLGQEEIVVATKGKRLLLAGGRPRGTLYAVSRFLQDQCGVRWWTPWASHVPRQATLRVGDLNVRYQPPFEYREPFWFVGFDPRWSVRNCANSQAANIPPELGGSVRYKGFVHTFYPLVPPAKHFEAHPEWFSWIDGRRSTNRAQLCLTNPQLRDFVVERVKEWLRESPEASIVSVSQNDWYGACRCEDCEALDKAEGSHAGTILAFVNYVAEKIEPDFPQVAIDTLAYQYTRKPPKTLKPRPNVIVRLCSIECNFREPLDHPSNASFADDIRGWSKICDRLYIWDYTTDFAHYVQAHPNWFTLGANVRFFQQHHVRGLFEQGAYQSYGSEMAELRAWVLAQLLWDPGKNDRDLVQEFLEGYYGPAAPLIQRYLEGMHEASSGYNLTCFSKTDTPFLRFRPLAKAERLWQQAESASAGHLDLTRRVRLGRLPLLYVWLSRWAQLRKECEELGEVWPLVPTRKEAAELWLEWTSGDPDAPWTHVKLINERGVTPQGFLQKLGEIKQ